MNTLTSGLLVAVGLLFGGVDTVASQALSDPGDPAERRAATASASEFLQLLDKGKIAETWPRTGKYIRSNLAQAAWVTSLRAMRLPAGALKSRTVITAVFAKRLDGAPDGHYFVVFFDSRFARANVEEKVIVNLEGKQWRVEGYFLEKTVELKP